jgi:hypothetical protein
MLRCRVGHGQETEQQRADNEPSEDEPLTRRQQHHRLGLETDGHTPVVAIEVLAQSGSLSVLLYPRLASLAGLAAHLLDDVVTAGQRLLRFKDLGPRASRPPTCLGSPTRAIGPTGTSPTASGRMPSSAPSPRPPGRTGPLPRHLASTQVWQALPAAETVASRSKKKSWHPSSRSL